MSQEAQRSAIVTGASRGIGKAIALRLVADGFAVTVNYAGSRAAAEAVAALVGPDGRWVSGQNVRANGGLI